MLFVGALPKVRKELNTQFSHHCEETLLHGLILMLEYGCFLLTCLGHQESSQAIGVSSVRFYSLQKSAISFVKCVFAKPDSKLNCTIG